MNGWHSAPPGPEVGEGVPIGDVPAGGFAVPDDASIGEVFAGAKHPARLRDRIRSGRAEVLAALAAAAVIAALGAPLGVLWQAVAPRLELTRGSDGWYPAGDQTERFIADDGWFVIIGAVAGVLLAVAVWLALRRFRGPVMLFGLAVGSVGGAVLAAWLGHRIALGDYPRQFREAAVGTHLYRPPTLRIADVGLWFGFLPRVRGVVLVQALTAVAGYTLFAAFHYAPSLRDGEPGDDDTDDEPEVSSGWSVPTSPTTTPAPPGPGPAGPPPGAATPAPPPAG